MIKENKFKFWISIIGALGLTIWITSNLFKLDYVFTLIGSITFVSIILIIHYQTSVGFKFVKREYS